MNKFAQQKNGNQKVAWISDYTLSVLTPLAVCKDCKLYMFESTYIKQGFVIHSKILLFFKFLENKTNCF